MPNYMVTVVGPRCLEDLPVLAGWFVHEVRSQRVLFESWLAIIIQL